MKDDEKLKLLIRAYFNVLKQELLNSDIHFLETKLKEVTTNVIISIINKIPRDYRYSCDVNDIKNSIESEIEAIKQSELFDFVLEQYIKLFFSALQLQQSEIYVDIILYSLKEILGKISIEEERQNLVKTFFRKIYSILDYCLKKNRSIEAVQLINFFLSHYIDGIDIFKIDYNPEYKDIFRKYFRLYGKLIVLNQSYKVFNSFCDLCAKSSRLSNSQIIYLLREFSLFASISI